MYGKYRYFGTSSSFVVKAGESGMNIHSGHVIHRIVGKWQINDHPVILCLFSSRTPQMMGWNAIICILRLQRNGSKHSVPLDEPHNFLRPSHNLLMSQHPRTFTSQLFIGPTFSFKYFSQKDSIPSETLCSVTKHWLWTSAVERGGWCMCTFSWLE